MARDIPLGRFTIEAGDVLQEATKLRQVILQLKEQQRQLKEENMEGSAEWVETESQLKAVNAEYRRYTKVMQESIEEQARVANRSDLITVALNEEATSIEQARQQNRELNKLRNTANLTTEQGREELEKLNAKLDANNEFIKENVDQYTQQKINIGNYREDIKGAADDLNIFNGGLLGMVGRMQEAGGATAFLGGAFKKLATGIWAATKASLAFIATPIGAVLAVLGVAIGALVTYFSQTQAGIDAVTSVTRPLMAVWDRLIGLVQELGAKLANPLEVLKELGDYIKKEAVTYFASLGTILDGIANRDFSKVKQGITELGAQAKKNVDLVADSVKGVVDEATDAFKVGQEIDKLQKQIEAREVNIKKEQAELNSLMRDQEIILRDRTRTVEEREAAGQRLIELEQQSADIDNGLIDLKKEKLRLEQSLNDTLREGHQEMSELEAEQIKINDRIKQRQATTIRYEQQYKTEREKAAKEVMKEQAAVLDNQLKLYLQQFEGRKQSAEMEIEIAEEVAKRQIEAAELAYEQSEKKESDKLDLLIATNEAEKELLQTKTEIVIADAERELELFKQTQEAKANELGKFNEEWLEREEERNKAILDEEIAFQELRLEQGLINEQEFQDAINLLKHEARLQDEENRRTFEQAQLAQRKEAELAEFETKILGIQQNARTEFEARREIAAEEYARDRALLEEKLANDLISQENYQAQLQLMNEQYADYQKELRRQEAEAEIDMAKTVLSGISDVLGKESAIGKAAAIAASIINTYQGVTKSLAQGGFLGIAQAAVVAAQGFKAVKKIISTKTPFEKGEGGAGGGNAESLGTGITASSSGVNMTQIAGSGNRAVQQDIERNTNDRLVTQLRDAVREGSTEGTRRGSSEGITNLSENKEVQRASSF